MCLAAITHKYALVVERICKSSKTGINRSFKRHFLVLHAVWSVQGRNLDERDKIYVFTISLGAIFLSSFGQTTCFNFRRR